MEDLFPVHSKYAFGVLFALGFAPHCFVIDTNLASDKHQRAIDSQPCHQFFPDFLQALVNNLFIGTPSVYLLRIVKLQPCHAQQEIVRRIGRVLDVERCR